MRNTYATFGIIIIFLISCFFPIAHSIENFNNIIYVDDDGGADFTHIQNAIDAARNGDTIFVYAGTYNENLVVDKTLTLTGEDKESTIIDGDGTDVVIFVNDVDGVSITDFTIRNNGMDYGVSALGVETVNILNNIFYNITKYAISLSGTSHSLVSNNEVYNCNGGIFLRGYSKFNIIDGNTVWDFVKDDYKGYYNKGVLIDTSEYNIISNNTIFSSPDVGISMSAPGRVSNNNTVKNNKIYNSLAGVSIQYAIDNQFYENLFQGNDYGSVLSNCVGNIFYQNDYINNDEQAFEIDSLGLNQWFNSSIKQGNFWDDYAGSDSNGDGIGDIPYDIEGDGNSKDLYPVMMPLHNIAPSNPNIYGPSSGKAGEEYIYNIYSSDLNDDDIYYFIGWGDETSSEWHGPFNSSSEQLFSHIWDDSGDYILRVKSKDVNDAESDWTTLEISMPKNKSINEFNPWLFRLIQRFPILKFLL